MSSVAWQILGWLLCALVVTTLIDVIMGSFERRRRLRMIVENTAALDRLAAVFAKETALRRATTLQQTNEETETRCQNENDSKV